MTWAKVSSSFFSSHFRFSLKIELTRNFPSSVTIPLTKLSSNTWTFPFVVTKHSSWREKVQDSSKNYCVTRVSDSLWRSARMNRNEPPDLILRWFKSPEIFYVEFLSAINIPTTNSSVTTPPRSLCLRSDKSYHFALINEICIKILKSFTLKHSRGFLCGQPHMLLTLLMLFDAGEEGKLTQSKFCNKIPTFARFNHNLHLNLLTFIISLVLFSLES